MLAEAAAGIGALKTAFDIAKGLKDIDDTTRRNAAVIELQEKILGAQLAQSTLIERINELEAKMAGFEQWDAQKKRYELKDFGGQTFAYALKPQTAEGEPPHKACPACYQKRQIGILNFSHNGSGRGFYDCTACGTQIVLGVRQLAT